ncbi:FadR/GntR family transcriptional regulator [Longispora albida]|uniref:FadR/GntR family transcriptional regulator n=1 Tax=Longispora albida TaxID=203523 RepID=UPI00036797DD|nr:GntR family transcriptional regulator [Longispora albida]
MELNPVARRSVRDDVFEQLVRNIVSGEAGDSLLSERQLAEALGVSRPVVREALQRLAHAGLIEVRQGGATTVRDFRRDAGLGVLAHLLVHDGQLDPSVARSVIEARLAVGPQIAGLAAGRAEPEHIGALDAMAGELAAEPDPVAAQRLALEFWDELVTAAGSIVFRLMFNNLRAAYEPLLEVLASVPGNETGRDYRSVVEAVRSGDSGSAIAAAHELLLPTTNALLDVLGRWENQQPD